MATERFPLKSAQFRREREASWRELEELLDRIDEGGLRHLDHDEARRLPTLHRMVTSSLSVARAISLDQNLLEYLTHLACRSHLIVYAGRREPLRAFAAFFGTRLPRLVRAQWRFVALAAGCFVLGLVTGWLLVHADPTRFYSFVPNSMAGSRTPEASDAELRAALHAQTTNDWLAAFASFLFGNNARVGMLCLFVGFAAGVPVAFVLFQNGLSLGAMAALYASRGLGTEFWGWVLPHGVTELLAAFLCGASGFVFGTSLLFPGRASRLENLSRRGRAAGLVVLGAVGLFFVAALFEGFFRQLVHATPVRYATAAAMTLVWIGYFGFAGRKGAHDALED
ncbi:MAG: stage II sporulation protein M [Candidatus Eisenbacteria bacterium]|uniref:Stage II sporulation protein M n=1 Tax=Eiseniibacteriota bacterium TaxID=2212470 RepID=A0A933W2N6_UNCEI|nr:stage II sporulation protein M [Candidatus Eisenbacteria bacterium]